MEWCGFNADKTKNTHFEENRDTRRRKGTNDFEVGHIKEYWDNDSISHHLSCPALVKNHCIHRNQYPYTICFFKGCFCSLLQWRCFMEYTYINQRLFVKEVFHVNYTYISLFKANPLGSMRNCHAFCTSMRWLALMLQNSNTTFKGAATSKVTMPVKWRNQFNASKQVGNVLLTAEQIVALPFPIRQVWYMLSNNQWQQYGPS